MLQHPFQCLAVAKPHGALDGYLLAACGSRLISTSLGRDATLFEWSAAPSAGEANDPKTHERPTKRQKTAPPAPVSSNVIKLTVCPDNHHVVAVTEDKLVRVFQMSGDGTLAELSQRAMPKRPCAIKVLPDNATILCGDKFGDVYSLPLLPEEKSDVPDATAGAEAAQAEKPAEAFKPSASNTTVHTKRNRKALEAQLKQKNLTAKIKEPLKFEHKLLLGHVSMLTDLSFATREVEGKRRSYIITTDRDEHIRISRGPPQSHVIEGYCLGHTQYVSKACTVPGTSLLVSGGGDSWIGVWDWASFKLQKKLDIADPLKAGLEDSSTRLKWSSIPVDSINVAGIWIVPMKINELVQMDRPVTEPAIVVACEGIPVMLVCPVADLLNGHGQFQPISEIEAPILDITSFEDMSIVTLDNRKNAHRRIWSFRLERDKNSQSGDVQFFADDELSEPMKRLNDVSAGVENEKALDGLLYGVANLRKRGYQNDDDGDDEGGAAGEAQEVEVDGDNAD